MRRRADVEQPTAGGGAERTVVQCACGLKMTIGTVQRNEGRCMGCGKVVTGAAIPDDSHPDGPPPVPDPAKLAAQSVQKAAGELSPPTEGVDYNRGEKPVQGESGGGLVMPVQPPAKQPGEMAFNDLAAGLVKCLGVDVSLPEVARWTPLQREQARKALESGGREVPEWLALKSASTVAKTPQEAMAKMRTLSTLGSEESAEGDTVSATWGEEKFSPGKGSFSMCNVGPFTFTTRVHSGESRQGALRRLNAELAEFASAERHRKIQDFVAKYNEFSKATA